MTLAVGRMDLPKLPVFSHASSFTRLATGGNDPLQALKRGVCEIALHSVRASVVRLFSREKDWDGFGSATPDRGAVDNALNLLWDLYEGALATGLPWLQPHITSSEDGQVVFEWWRGSHKLILYVAADGCEYVKVWGPNINTQMKDGVLVGDQFQGLWRWLLA